MEKCRYTKNLVEPGILQIQAAVQEEFDKVCYGVFEDCGYNRDEVLDLLKSGRLTGRYMDSVEYGVRIVTFSVDGEELFSITSIQELDLENLKVTFTNMVDFRKEKQND